MATTTNYGWTTPDDTDLVKDGAAAIRTLGSSVDTTTKALNPETTTGDISYRSATANTNTRLALGTAGQVLTVNSGATAPEWASPAGGGKVLQVVYGMYDTQTLINNAGYTDTGLSLSITPSLATSKILVLSSNFVYFAESSGNPGIGTRIVRTSTTVYEQHPNQNSFAIVGPASGNRGLLGSVNMQYLDSPNTTSATTYKTQAKSNCSAYLQWDAGKSNIILMEIGA
jgi:hypothetical protein